MKGNHSSTIPVGTLFKKSFDGFMCSSGDPQADKLSHCLTPTRGGATLWLGGAWAPPSPRAPPKEKKKSKKRKKKYNFYPYSLKDL
jgi:hypothetical protein